MSPFNRARRFWREMLFSVVLGMVGIGISGLSGWAVLDPLLVALVLGILIRSVFNFSAEKSSAFSAVPLLLIPPGVVFYGAVNLKFTEFASIQIEYSLVLFLVFLTYLIASLVLANTFRINEKTAFLIATGSTICGASAIAITSQAVDADSRHISHSLIGVFFAGLIGLFLICPVTASLLGMREGEIAFMNGAVLQFTGFVKVSVAGLSAEAAAAAMSIKTLRYLGLLFVIPIFASFVRNRFYIPWYLWAFVGAGGVFSLFAEPLADFFPFCRTALKVLWCAAMAAIGLNCSIRELFTAEGVKCFLVSLMAFMVATAVFVVGMWSV